MGMIYKIVLFFIIIIVIIIAYFGIKFHHNKNKNHAPVVREKFDEIDDANSDDANSDDYRDEIKSEHRFNKKKIKNKTKKNPKKIYKSISDKYNIFMNKLYHYNIDYKFNIGNLPVMYDREIGEQLEKNIVDVINNAGNPYQLKIDMDQAHLNYDKNIYLHRLYLIDNKYTDSDALVSYIAELYFYKKTIYLKIVFYKLFSINIDIYLTKTKTKNESDYRIVKIILLKKSEFDSLLNNRDSGKFMSMRHQLSYVDKVHKLHQNEVDEYKKID